MIVADTSGLTQGLELTKREIAKAKRDADAATGGVGAYRDRRQTLEAAFGQGHISAEGLTAATSKLNQEFLAGIPVLGQFAGMLNPVTAATTLATAGLTAMAGGVALVGAKISERLTALDGLGDEAARLNADVAGLSRLAIAADLGDVDRETLVTSLKKMQAEVGKATIEGEKYDGALKRIGLDAAQLARLDSATMFEKIAEKIRDLPTQAEKMAVIREIFGKAAGDLWPLITGLDELKAKADETGAVVGKGLAGKAGEFDEATKRLQHSWDALGNSITSLAVGPLTDIVNLLNTASKSPLMVKAGLGGAIGAVFGLSGVGMGNTLGNAMEASRVHNLQDIANAKAEESDLNVEIAKQAAAEADSEKRRHSDKIADMRFELDLLGKTADEVVRLRALREGASDAQADEMAALKRQDEERRAAIQSEREAQQDLLRMRDARFADDKRRGEEASRLRDSLAEDAGGPRDKIMRAFERDRTKLQAMGMFDLEAEAGLINRTSRELMAIERGGAFGGVNADKGTRAAREAVIAAQQQQQQTKRLDDIRRELVKISSKPELRFVRVEGD